MAKAVGVGGVFLKASDPEKLSAWYAEHLGIPSQNGGSLAFDGPESTGMTVFAHFPETTKYFGEGSQQAMVNFRVDNLDELLVHSRPRMCASIPTAKITGTDVSRGYGTRREIGWSCGSLGTRRNPTANNEPSTRSVFRARRLRCLHGIRSR